MWQTRCLVAAIVLTTVACGSQSAPPPAPGSADGKSPDSPISVLGTERLGWDLLGSDAAQASGILFTAYVDDVPAALDARCQQTAETAFTCTASLPPMLPGPHRLELTATAAGLESAHSLPIYMTVAFAKSTTAPIRSGAVSRVVTTLDGTRIVVDTIATGLDAPSALAMTADGRIFIAQASGDVSVWQGNQILSPPALTLRDAQRVTGAGLIGMTLDPQFGSNRRIYLAYVGLRSDGTVVNRVVRFRELNNVLREAVVILEDAVPVVAPQPPRIRFGPDQKLYVAFPAADWPTVDSFASYAGKILRLNDDGTTPRDNPRSSPIISTGHVATAGFDWQPKTGRLWLAEYDRQGRDVLGFLSPAFETSVAAVLDSALAASGAAFYSANAFPAFTNDLFVAGAAGQQIRRVHFDPRDASRVDSTERLLEGQFGRLSDVVAGSDGMLYVCTSNRGLSSAAPDDDLLLRLSPARP
jgi:glucose/arabinose dehydrogenase